MNTIARKKIIDKISKTSREQKVSINGINLLLNKHTLVPHPDTLELCEIAKGILQKNSWLKTIADIGTGSGIIAIKLGIMFPKKRLFASDINEKALKMAVKNAKLNGIKNIRFLLNTDGVWLSELREKNIDFIISNPPFVSQEEYSSREFINSYPEVKLEPMQAIVASGVDGLDPYLEVLKNSVNNRTKLYLFQCNSLNIHKLKKMIIGEFKNYKVKIKKNQAGLDKFMFIKNPEV